MDASPKDEDTFFFAAVEEFRNKVTLSTVFWYRVLFWWFQSLLKKPQDLREKSALKSWLIGYFGIENVFKYFSHANLR